MEGQKNDKNNKEQILQLKINLFQDFFKKKKRIFSKLRK